jgi:transposase
MSEEDCQVPIWSYRVNLDKRWRSDHPLRRIRATLDLSSVRKGVAHTYGQKGNKSVPPEVIVRMMLLLFLDDIKSERELMRIIPERLDCLWFLGYGLDDQIPDHSVLSKARKRWGKEVFASLFSQVVRRCVAAGLVEGTPSCDAFRGVIRKKAQYSITPLRPPTSYPSMLSQNAAISGWGRSGVEAVCGTYKVARKNG